MDEQGSGAHPGASFLTRMAATQLICRTTASSVGRAASRVGGGKRGQGGWAQLCILCLSSSGMELPYFVHQIVPGLHPLPLLFPPSFGGPPPPSPAASYEMESWQTKASAGPADRQKGEVEQRFASVVLLVVADPLCPQTRPFPRHGTPLSPFEGGTPFRPDPLQHPSPPSGDVNPPTEAFSNTHAVT